MSAPDVDRSLDRVLAVLDRTVLVAIPILVLGNLIQPPTGAPLSVVSFAAMIGLMGVLAILGRTGRAPWRRTIYPVVALAGAVIGLWSNGPLAGVGAVFGLATLLAGSFLSRAGLVAVVTVGITAIALRASLAIGVWSGSGESEQIPFATYPLWMRVAIGTGVILWVSTRVIGELLSSLELSYARAAEAYRNENETRRQLERSRQQLEEVEQVALVGRLAGGVAHDVNNALTAILAASDVIGDEVATDEERTHLTELEAASHHAADLVRDLLWIGQKLPPATEAAHLDQAVQACRARIGRMARKIDIDLQLEGPIRVEIAPERLEQLLFWLVLGAHRSGVGQLALAGRSRDGTIEIDLHGLAGAGAPSTSLDLRPKAFRARLSTAAIKEVVEQAGGSLTMTDTGGLMHAQIRLPEATAERRPTPRRGDQARTALVVEDEPVVLERLARLIARRGYQVATASSLAEAWPLLAAEPDLLVTDLQLGDGRGEDLAIASFERHPERPIIVCSGFGADDALRERLRDANVTFLAKPFTRAELEAAIPAIGESAG